MEVSQDKIHSSNEAQRAELSDLRGPSKARDLPSEHSDLANSSNPALSRAETFARKLLFSIAERSEFPDIKKRFNDSSVETQNLFEILRYASEHHRMDFGRKVITTAFQDKESEEFVLSQLTKFTYFFGISERARLIDNLLERPLDRRKIKLVNGILTGCRDLAEISALVEEVGPRKLLRTNRNALRDFVALRDIVSEIRGLPYPPIPVSHSSPAIINIAIQETRAALNERLRLIERHKYLAKSEVSQQWRSIILANLRELKRDVESQVTPSKQRTALERFMKKIEIEHRWGVRVTASSKGPNWSKRELSELRAALESLQEGSWFSSSGPGEIRRVKTPPEGDSRTCGLYDQGKLCVYIGDRATKSDKDFVNHSLLRGTIVHEIYHALGWGDSSKEIVDPITGKVHWCQSPYLDFRGFAQKFGWTAFHSSRYKLIDGNQAVLLDGKRYPLNRPIQHQGENLTLIYGEDEKMLFGYRPTARFALGDRTTASPHEHFAEAGAWYSLDPERLINYSPESFHHFELEFRKYDRDQAIQALYERSMEKEFAETTAAPVTRSTVKDDSSRAAGSKVMPRAAVPETESASDILFMKYRLRSELPEDFYPRTIKKILVACGNEYPVDNYYATMAYLNQELNLRLDHHQEQVFALLLTNLAQTNRFGGDPHIHPHLGENSAAHSCHSAILVNELFRRAQLLTPQSQTAEVNRMRLLATIGCIIHDNGEMWGELNSLSQRVTDESLSEDSSLETKIFEVILRRAHHYVYENRQLELHSDLDKMRSGAKIIGGSKVDANQIQGLIAQFETPELRPEAQDNVDLILRIYKLTEDYDHPSITRAERFVGLLVKAAEHIQGTRHLLRFCYKAPDYQEEKYFSPSSSQITKEIPRELPVANHHVGLPLPLAESRRILKNADYMEKDLGALCATAQTPSEIALARAACQAIYLTAAEFFNTGPAYVDRLANKPDKLVAELQVELARGGISPERYLEIYEQMAKQLEREAARLATQALSSENKALAGQLARIESAANLKALYLRAARSGYMPKPGEVLIRLTELPKELMG